MTERGHPHIVLASQSASRRQMLKAAGVVFEAMASDVDEAALKRQIDAEVPVTLDLPAQIARVLAAAKAVDVSRKMPGALVIGSDQTLWLEMWGQGKTVPWMLSKAKDVAKAREHLMMLRGATHHLCSAAAIALDGAVVWEADRTAHMTMRPFSEAFLDAYLAQVGENVCSSVGCYQLEGPGVQLFEAIDGDFFTVLGMPLLDVLDALRRRGAIKA